MGSIWGDCLRLSVFGESHGEGIGVVIDGFPPGVRVDYEFISHELARRAPGSPGATTRRESDEPRFLSGIFNDITTGAPICAVIGNTNVRSGDYADFARLPRPSHADYTSSLRYNGFSDYRGGGHFSGRLTAPIVLAGALCRLYLSDMRAAAHLYSVGVIEDMPYRGHYGYFDMLSDAVFPTLDADAGRQMLQLAHDLRETGDSTGGVVECVCDNIPAGLGNPTFGGVEQRIASLLFSIPGVKGVEFGAGFEISKMRGSESNDPFIFENNKVRTTSNHSGGIQGGITNGMPVVVRAAFKPTPSIAREQDTVDLESRCGSKILIGGRHDPCIAFRAVPVVEAACAIAFTDLILGQQ